MQRMRDGEITQSRDGAARDGKVQPAKSRDRGLDLG
jgi:hypothetical protein